MLISINCFQSILKSKVDFKGFAVVTGESNLGKSALIRAVSAAVFGLPGDTYVRWGTPASGVGVRFDDNLTLKWQKVPAPKKAPGRETTLDIDGVVHTKLGRDHFSLTSPLGFVSLSTPAGELRPQVARQFDQPFLLDVSESVVAEVFGTLGRGDIVASARDSAKRDLGRAKSEHKVRDKDLVDAKDQVAAKSWVRPAAAEVSALQIRVLALVPLERTVTAISEWLAVDLPSVIPHTPPVPHLDDKLKLLLGLLEVKSFDVPSLPAVWEIEELTLLQRVVALIDESNQLGASKEALEVVTSTKQRELIELEATLGVCPTCGSKFKDHDGLQH